MSDSFEDLQRIVGRLDPAMGFRAVEVVSGKEHSLHAGFYVGGKPVEIAPGRPATEMVWCQKPITDAGYGVKQRLKQLLEAMCRFINAGGSFTELKGIVKLMAPVLDGVKLELTLPGFHLINFTLNDEGVPEYLFAKDGCPHAIRWVEGQFFDVVSLTDLQRELEDEPRVSFGNSYPQASAMELQHRPRLGASPEDQNPAGDVPE